MKASFFAATAVMLAVAGPAAAHHSNAWLDMQKEIVLNDAVVAEFQWTNPHVWIELDVPDGKGTVKRWSIEAGSVTGLARQGWKRSSLKPGDKISRIAIHPMKSGDPGGGFIGLEFTDGRKLGSPVDRKAPDASAAPPSAAAGVK